MTKKEIRDKAFNFLGQFDKKIKTKLNNVCGKTGQYNVPSELFQKRTPRKNRVLISWKTVKNNNLTLKQLESFTGGVVVEFVNEDYFNEDNFDDPLFLELRKRLGSDKIVSSMISIRTEDGSSSSIIPRESFKKLETEFPDYKKFLIRRKKGINKNIGIGNDKWEGFIFVSIRGGQQKTRDTHKKAIKYQLFNPACEYANEEISLDIDLVMSYFALHSIEVNKLNQKQFEIIKIELENTLKQSKYENASFVGNLLDYCKNHPCLKMVKDKLYDPIEVEKIDIFDFAVTKKENIKNIDFTHDEAVNLDKYYWDKKHNCILTPSRPTNIFWSRHLSNMMQQNFSLSGYFDHQEEIVKRRKNLLNKNF